MHIEDCKDLGFSEFRDEIVMSKLWAKCAKLIGSKTTSLWQTAAAHINYSHFNCLLKAHKSAPKFCIYFKSYMYLLLENDDV